MEKRNILVTGVSRGLGIEIAQTLLQDENVNVYGLSRSKPEELEALINQYPDRMKWMEYDLSDSVNVKKIFREFVGMKTPLHGFVNNAAMAYDDIVTNLNLDKLKAMYDVNVFTPMMMTKSFIRHCLLHNVKGSIVHISSISVHTGYKGLAMYASSKGALEAFSKDTAREWGEKGIRSNALVAGFMETAMSSTLSADQKDRIYKRTSMKKPTTTKSVAETIRFLLTDGAESITAQNIFVDSGTI
ncbi:SDR family NAD(P)-dependent oxidoreductase [Parabacteroides distasonis]|jgi:3-oxoacyl-[acyl-carrier protein] reductase|uniref:SDR family NAD(P)-dependent oxidoreductase n=1 Tax=Parabacteroides distasonis TaxID=823 RepID=UPI001896BA46|nr:SDR family oxidoreductase [Parabacteroides distasonis]MDB8998122.1 SDR family NAD(P)-dependent oxidoreductase [Parabacteroides distasonis]MDB9072773.1 SDR family NAD(P)-dependent oxidoreductase [Parabacteroides distasonis]